MEPGLPRVANMTIDRRPAALAKRAKAMLVEENLYEKVFFPLAFALVLGLPRALSFTPVRIRLVAPLQTSVIFLVPNTLFCVFACLCGSVAPSCSDPCAPLASLLPVGGYLSGVSNYGVPAFVL